jgi:hypothetical protein
MIVRPSRRRAVSRLVLLLLLLLGAGLGHAQDFKTLAPLFRVEWERRTGFWRPAIEGYVYNDSDYRVGNVRLHITVLDSSGAKVGEKTAWIYGAIDGRARGYFVAPLPEAGQTYQIRVDSCDVLARQAP